MDGADFYHADRRHGHKLKPAEIKLLDKTFRPQRGKYLALRKVEMAAAGK